MPRHNRPELGETLRKRFDCDPPASFDTIAPEIVPVVLADAGLESFISRPAVGAHARAGAAGFHANIQLWNPAESGIVAVVSQVIIHVATSMFVHLREYNVALANVVTLQRWRDTGISGTPACQTREENLAAAVGDQLAIIYALQNRQEPIPCDITLEPGWGLLVHSTTQNVNLTGTFYWKELQERV